MEFSRQSTTLKAPCTSASLLVGGKTSFKKAYSFKYAHARLGKFFFPLANHISVHYQITSISAIVPAKLKPKTFQYLM